MSSAGIAGSLRKLIDEVERQVVKTPIAKPLKKLLGGSRIFGRLQRSLRAATPEARPRQQEPNLHKTLARHQGAPSLVPGAMGPVSDASKRQFRSAVLVRQLTA